MVKVTFQIKPNARESSEFWSNIWLIPGNFNKNASWLPKVKERLSEFDKQEDIRISVENVKTAIRKMSNWKVPGPDYVQGYWFKRLTEHLQTCVVEGDVPTWMTKGRTALIQKDSEKGNVARNYRPIACLPLMWKLLISTLTEKVYAHLFEKNVKPDEQKECRKDSRGTKDQLLIDKQVLNHCKKHQHNLAMGWIDYKKVYGMVPQSLVD